MKISMVKAVKRRKVSIPPVAKRSLFLPRKMLRSAVIFQHLTVRFA
jgi:hypothetical protein